MWTNVLQSHNSFILNLPLLSPLQLSKEVLQIPQNHLTSSNILVPIQDIRSHVYCTDSHSFSGKYLLM